MKMKYGIHLCRQSIMVSRSPLYTKTEVTQYGLPKLILWGNTSRYDCVVRKLPSDFFLTGPPLDLMWSGDKIKAFPPHTLHPNENTTSSSKGLRLSSPSHPIFYPTPDLLRKDLLICHAFWSEPTRGVFILWFYSKIIGASRGGGSEGFEQFFCLPSFCYMKPFSNMGRAVMSSLNGESDGRRYKGFVFSLFKGSETQL